MSYEGTTPDMSFSERSGFGVGRSDLSAVDLRIGGPDPSGHDLVPEPAVVRRAELSARPDANSGLAAARDAAEMAGPEARNTDEGSSYPDTTEFGGRVAVSGALEADTVDTVHPADTPGSGQLSSDEVTATPMEDRHDLGLSPSPAPEEAPVTSSVTKTEAIDDHEDEKTPEETYAEQKAVMKGMLRLIASEYESLREWQGRLWDGFVGRLEELPLSEISRDEHGDFVAEWRVNLGRDQPEPSHDVQNQSADRQVTVAMNSRDMYEMPDEALKALAELHGDAAGAVPASEKRDTPLLGVEARVSQSGDYEYDRNDLMTQLGKVMPGYAVKAEVTFPAAEEADYVYSNARVEVEAVSWRMRQLPEDLQTVLNGEDGADRIVAKHIERVRIHTQAQTADWNNHLAFPTDKETIRREIAPVYLDYAASDVEKLDQVNHALRPEV